MKSPPMRIPVNVFPRFPQRFDNDSGQETYYAQAELLHPQLNLLTEGMTPSAQSDAAHRLVRGGRGFITVTVDDEGNLEQLDPVPLARRLMLHSPFRRGVCIFCAGPTPKHFQDCPWAALQAVLP